MSWGDVSWGDVVAAALLLAGSALALTAAIGVLRFPDTLARMHAATKPQTVGLLFVLAGAAILLRGNLDVGMLLLAGMFQLITAPVIAQRVGRLAHQEQCRRDDLLVVDELAEDLLAEHLRAGNPRAGDPRAGDRADADAPPATSR